MSATPEGLQCSQYVHPKHPPDQEKRDNGPRNMNYPVARCFRFSKIEHCGMVAGTSRSRSIALTLIGPDRERYCLVPCNNSDVSRLLHGEPLMPGEK
jgi:hypothetical protein